MSTSPLLNFDYIQASQSTKEVTSNAADDRITQALCKYLSIAMTDANYTLSVIGAAPEAYANMMLNFTGTLTAQRNIVVPSTNKLYIIRNSTTGGFGIQVIAASGTGYVVPNGKIKLVFFDGTNVVEVASPASAISLAFTGLSDVPASYSGQALKFVRVNAGATALEFTTLTLVTAFTGLSDVPASYSGQALKAVRVNAGATALEFFTLATVATSGAWADLTAKPYDFAFFFPGVMTNAQMLARIVAVRGFSYPSSMTGSDSKAGTAATGSTTITFKKNAVSFATLVFSAAGTVGAWTSASGATFVAGDILTVEGPATADATLADTGITLKGTAA